MSSYLGEALGPALGGVLLLFISFQHIAEGMGVLGTLITAVYLLASPKPCKESED